jgi:hypothetical protein
MSEPEIENQENNLEWWLDTDSDEIRKKQWLHFHTPVWELIKEDIKEEIRNRKQ